MTPRAAAAIIGQINNASDVWTERYDSKTDTLYNVGFAVYCEWERTLYPYPSGYVCECTIIGAYADDDAGNVRFAGNRDELIARIGEKTVRAWEDAESHNQTERAAA